MNRTKILLVEDDSNLRFVIEDNLIHEGFVVNAITDGKTAIEKFQEFKPDLCLLDVMLPNQDGFSIAESIRNLDEKIPILFLTAKNQIEDKIKGLELGANDYITKPFNMRELILRVQLWAKNNENQESEKVLFLSNTKFDYHNLQLVPDGSEVSLTQKEGDILYQLFSSPNQIIKREQILNTVWGDDDYFIGRSLDVFISKLRKYLKPDDGLEIVNHHGVGFKLKSIK